MSASIWHIMSATVLLFAAVICQFIKVVSRNIISIINEGDRIVLPVVYLAATFHTVLTYVCLAYKCHSV
jgi:hypothetical protein